MQHRPSDQVWEERDEQEIARKPPLLDRAVAGVEQEADLGEGKKS
jgi:hypothetical protein